MNVTTSVIEGYWPMSCIYHESPAEIHAREMAERSEREQVLTAPLIAKIDIQGRQIAHLEAMLCGVLSSVVFLSGYHDAALQVEGRKITIMDAVRDYYNEDESGVTWNYLEEWWADHKLQDARRKQAEAEAREQKRAAALSKLTQEEREILGV